MATRKILSIIPILVLRVSSNNFDGTFYQWMLLSAALHGVKNENYLAAVNSNFS